MSYVTLPVDIADGRITPREPEKMPAQGHGYLTILSESHLKTAVPPVERLRALRELRKSLALTPEKAAAWMETIRDQKF